MGTRPCQHSDDDYRHGIVARKIGECKTHMLPEQAKSILSNMLHPVDYNDFFDKIIERQPLVIRGDNNPARLNIIGPDPRDTILNSYEQFAPYLTCHALAPTWPKPHARHVESKQAFLQLLAEYHEREYTVRIPDVTGLSEKLQLFTRALEVIVENPVDVVIFWSLTDAKAPIHLDRHDIFCIQLVGEKKWFLSKDQAALPNPWKSAGEGPPPFDAYDTVTVKPGDLIYLPRGTAHTVHSQSESIHLSIGFSPVTVREGLIALIDYLSDQERSLRAGLFTRADNAHSQDSSGHLISRLGEAIDLLRQNFGSDGFVEAAMHQRKSRMIQGLNKLTKAEPVSNLTPSSRLRQKPLSIINVVKTDHNLDISQPNETILIHPGAEVAVNFITNTVEFSISEIPGDLETDVIQLLVSRFLTSGLLEVID